MTKKSQNETKVNIEELQEFAEKTAQELKGGEIFGLMGDLGAGKTTFVQLLAKQLGITSRVTSPTFVIVASHKGILPSTGDVVDLHHLDVYRLNHPSEFLQLGIAEVFSDPTAVVFIEWADKIRDILPSTTKYIRFTNRPRI